MWNVHCSIWYVWVLRVGMQVMATIFGFTSHVVCTDGSSLHAVMRLCGGQAVGMIALVGLSLVH